MIVDVRKRVARITLAGRLVRRFPVVVGRRGTPTPRGLFAVYDVVRQAHAGGFFGPWALHLTAHSQALDDFGRGPGRVAVHGRGGASVLDPLGTARSHGCVRAANANVRYLARVAGAGTPVQIR